MDKFKFVSNTNELSIPHDIIDKNCILYSEHRFVSNKGQTMFHAQYDHIEKDWVIFENNLSSKDGIE